MEPEVHVHQVSAGLTQEALVQKQAAAAERARTQRLLDPLAPLWVVAAVGLLVLRLEHSDTVLSTTNIKL